MDIETLRKAICCLLVLALIPLMNVGCRKDNRDKLPPPGKVRLYCAICGAWAEGRSPNAMAFNEFEKPAETASSKAEEEQESAFMEKHMDCMLRSIKTGTVFRWLYPNDKLYHQLDPAKQERYHTPAAEPK